MNKPERTSDKVNIPSHFIDVHGAKMHYLESGAGRPILFLHGIPTSSYLWRNVIPQLSSLGRCIAPDLIGFGQSARPNIPYTVFDHIKYIEGFIEALNLKRITLVMHGWGSVIGLDYAMRHEKNCRGLVFYEAFLRSTNGDDLSLPYQEQLMTLQNQENAFDLAASGASFVDYIIPQNIMHTLSKEAMQAYRSPFEEEGSGKPIQQYLKELPTGNGNGEVDKLIAAYSNKLTQSTLPKLMLYSVPGFITTIATAIWAKENLPKLEMVDIGEELHLAQETCPELIGKAISAWMQGLEYTHV